MVAGIRVPLCCPHSQSENRMHYRVPYRSINGFNSTNVSHFGRIVTIRMLGVIIESTGAVFILRSSVIHPVTPEHLVTHWLVAVVVEIAKKSHIPAIVFIAIIVDIVLKTDDGALGDSTGDAVMHWLFNGRFLCPCEYSSLFQEMILLFGETSFLFGESSSLNLSPFGARSSVFASFLRRILFWSLSLDKEALSSTRAAFRLFL
ncbi:hypothetical protein FN846DRAFT_886259 [Sphaerosporella brunnea]|uniref:Uncharacterized protein n=1 Tax=Sphaerosporella brunnea TaxID=1250544 RepID=A0A5J5F9B8_9PEZI|nr:hypothetical protein FN846DRAFT_886259 [Sphaerosporella brunnea]